MRRKLVTLFVLGGGILTALAALRRAGRARDRADVYYADGSLVTLVDGEAQPLLDIAHSVLGRE